MGDKAKLSIISILNKRKEDAIAAGDDVRLAELRYSIERISASLEDRQGEMKILGSELLKDAISLAERS